MRELNVPCNGRETMILKQNRALEIRFSYAVEVRNVDGLGGK